VLSSRDSLELW